MNKIEIIGTKECIYTHRLDNGLDIYMVPNNKVNNFYITLNVKFGSIYTNYEYNGKEYHNPKGIAHYLEHLMFNMPEGDAFEYFAKLGASANAFTSNDVTCYEVFANNKFKENLEYLIKYVFTPYFKKELVNKERGIITEEIKMYKDDPATELFHGFYENIFTNDERRYLVAGEEKDIKEIKVADLEDVYKAFYHPENMFLIITGNFNPEEALAITSESMSKIGFAEHENPILIEEKEPFEINNAYNSRKMNVSKPKVVVGYKIPKSNFKSLKLSELELRLYLNLIMSINFGATSIINEEMQSNNILNKRIGIRITDTKDYFIISLVAESEYPDYFVNRITKQFDNLTIQSGDIERKVKSAISSLVLLFDNIEAVNMEIQDDILKYNMVITDIYKIYKGLNEETAIEVMNKIGKYLQVVNVINSLDETA